MNRRGMGGKTELELATGAVDEDNLPILVIKDTRSKAFGGTFVQAKSVDPFAVEYFASVLQRMGHSEVNKKSDGKRSLLIRKREDAEKVPRNPEATEKVSLQSRSSKA